VAVFAVPEHLLSLWWETAGGGPEGAVELEPFARAFAGFARFKRMPLPDRCTFVVLATPPGMVAEGLGEPASVADVAGVNLGEETAAVVLCNLPPGAPAAGPDYPLVRLILEPGEGLWLPAGLTWSRCTLQTRELELWLAVRRVQE
jgi:hypothetical protein